jgi:Transposase domain (DUF772)
LRPIERHWWRETGASGRSAANRGRPSIAMETYVRLIVVKQRTGWGYETLVREVSDSLHLRRFCLVPLGERVPDESTVRKLTRRLGSEVRSGADADGDREGGQGAALAAAGGAGDSTVVEADVRYPTDDGLALQGARALAAQGRRLARRIGESQASVRDRSRAIGRRVREIGRTLGRRTGGATERVMELNGQAGLLLARSAREAKRLAATARRRARGRGARAKLRAAAELEELAGRCERVAEQIAMRLRGEKIPDRLVSIADPDARPIRKGKLGKPNEFGYLAQICEVTETPSRGRAGWCCRPPPRRAARARTPCCRPRWPSSSGAGCGRRRSRSTGASATSNPSSSSPRSKRAGCSSRAAKSPARTAPAGGCGATAPAPGSHLAPQAPLRAAPLTAQGR